MRNNKSIKNSKDNQLKIELYKSVFTGEYSKKYLQWASEYSQTIIQIENTIDKLRETNKSRYNSKKQEYFKVLSDLTEIQEFLIDRAFQLEMQAF